LLANLVKRSEYEIGVLTFTAAFAAAAAAELQEGNK
jgi:hypothetical protein